MTFPRDKDGRYQGRTINVVDTGCLAERVPNLANTVTVPFFRYPHERPKILSLCSRLPFFPYLEIVSNSPNVLHVHRVSHRTA